MTSSIQARARLTRERLLAAAISRFAAVGYEASTTRDIEFAAGVKRGLIAYHFCSKEALWKAAAARLLHQVHADWQETERHAANIDVAARQRYFVRAYVRLCASHPDLNRLMVQEGRSDDWRLVWLIEEFVRPWYRRVTQVLADAGSTSATTMDPLHFYYILTGAASLIFTMAPEARLLSGTDPVADEVIDAHADALANLLFPEERT